MKILTDVELRSAKAGGARAVQVEMQFAVTALNFALQKPELDDVSVGLSNLLALHNLQLELRREGPAAVVPPPEKTEAEKFAEAVGCNPETGSLCASPS